MERRDVFSADENGGVNANRNDGWTRAAFLDRFAPQAAGTDRVRSDYDLNPHIPRSEKPLRDAAVLVGLVERDEGLTVMFTQRTAHLNAHAGQISFPGGGMEAEDAGPERAALRETMEEIGLGADRIEIVGRLDVYRTRTGFNITPVVGLIRPPFDLTLDAFEVAEAFEVPLQFFLGDGMPKRHGRELLGKPAWYYVFPWRERYIWGATAGMLVNLRDVLKS